MYRFASEGPALAAFGEIRSTRGPVLRLDDLVSNEVFVNDDAAEEFGASVGDNLRVFGPRRPAHVRLTALMHVSF